MQANIHLRTMEKQLYLCAENGGGGPVVANRANPLQWETFRLIDPNNGLLMSGDAIILQAYDGRYVCAEDGGGGEVVANRSVPRQWETFKIIHADRSSGPIMDGEQVALIAYNGLYVCAEDGGGREVNANRINLGPWETFTIEITGTAPLQAYGIDRGVLGKGQHMETKVTFSSNGRVDVENHIWTNNEFFGFTGGVVVFFLDMNTNVIGNTPLWKYGVDGTWIPGKPSSRTILEHVDVGSNVFSRTAAIDIRHMLTPQNRLVEDINQGKEIGKSIAEVIAIISALSA